MTIRKIFTREKLEWLFLTQMKTMRLRHRGGCWPKIILALEAKKEGVLGLATRTEMALDRIPFTPVIPRQVEPIFYQYQVVCPASAKGYKALKDEDLAEEGTSAPTEPYFILNVDDGAGTTDVSYSDALTMLKMEKRSTLLIQEVIALCTHTQVLLDRQLVSASTIAGSNVLLYRPTGGKVNWEKVDPNEQPLRAATDMPRGTPSCSIRFYR